MSDKIEITEDRGVLRVAFNHIEKKNSILPEMYQALLGAFDRLEEDKSIRVLMLEGKGDMFTAGNDMASFLAVPPDLAPEDNPTLQLMKKAALAKKPLIAAVNGPAVGIGVTLLCSFDLVYAAKDAWFLTPFVNIGIVPEAGSSVLMPLNLGWQSAAEFLLTGDKISAQRAYDMGMVNRLLPVNEVADAAFEAALSIAAKPPASVRMTKAMMKGDTSRIEQVIEDEMKLVGERTQSAEVKEAVAAFMEKRKPDFSNFD